MSSSQIAKTSRVERAVDRLAQSIERLDAALAAAPAPAVNDDTATADLRAENARLKSLNAATTDKLSAVIARLDGLLADEPGA